jgi:hypothetical protein
MQALHIVSALLVGAVVGCITNWIAIKMLFRPLKPVMLGRFRVPFTPGIVPKRKDALAEILGRAIVDKFFNADDLELVFRSDAMADAFADCAVSLFTDDGFRLGDIKLIGGGADQELYRRLRDELCVRVQGAMLRADLPGLLTAEAGRLLENRAGISRLLPLLAEPLKERLEKFILTESRPVILPILDDELRELAALPAAEITSALFPDAGALRDAARSLHQQFMLRYVRPIVESIDVGGMITEKVRQMTAGEVESLVLTVVNRELRYVVLLGAVIGMLIGAVNIFT